MDKNDKKRAERRRKKRAVGQKMYNIYHKRYEFEPDKEDPDMKKLVNFYGSTKKPCSCSMCGNPRKFYAGDDKYTIQERKHMQEDTSEDGEEIDSENSVLFGGDETPEEREAEMWGKSHGYIK